MTRAEVVHYIAYFLGAMFHRGETIEIRVLHPPARGAKSLTTANFVAAAEFAYTWNQAGWNCYFVINPVTPDRGRHACARDKHVVRRNDLYIDIDPERVGVAKEMKSKVCSTDQEKQACSEVLQKVRDLLEGRFGWPSPVYTDSGSGLNLHHLVTDDCKPDPATWELLLRYLAQQCDTERAHVDPSVYGASRAARLPGTVNRKGEHTLERPQRLAHVIDWALGAPRLTQAQFDHAIAEAGIQVPPKFDPEIVAPMTAKEKQAGERLIVDLLELYPGHLRLANRKPKVERSKTLYYLAACPWVERKHEGSHSCIVLHANGNLGYICFAGTCPCNVPDKLRFKDLLPHLRDLTGVDSPLRRKLYPTEEELQAAFPCEMLGPLLEGCDEPIPFPEAAPAPAAAPPPPPAAIAPAAPEPLEEEPPPTLDIALHPATAPRPEPERAPVQPPASTKRLHIDFETRSEADLKIVGLDNYWEHASTELLLLGWAFDEDPVQVVDFTAGETLPPELLAALTDPTIEKVAWNAAFEVCGVLTKLDVAVDLRQWTDPSVLARYLGFPFGLEDCTVALHLAQTKDGRGKDLIKTFSSRTKAKVKQIKMGVAELYWRTAATDPESWDCFKDYCAIDVAVMRDAFRELESYTGLPAHEQSVWRFDLMVNFVGLPVDLQYVDHGIELVDAADEAFTAELIALTGVENPGSPEQMKCWCAQQGYAMESIAEAPVAEALKDPELSPLVRQALEIYQKISGAGPKKLRKIRAMVSSDGRLRHQYIYCGTHTHRWSSKGVQMQNLSNPTRAVADRLTEATDAIRSGYIPEGLDVGDCVTSTLRSAIRAGDHNTLVVSDLKNIESRVLGLFSGCRRLIDIFRQGLDPYRAFAAILFNIPYDEVTKAQRNAAKPATLGLGFGMGLARFIAYAATWGVILTEKEAKRQIRLFRSTFSELKVLWKAFGKLAIEAIKGRTVLWHAISGISFDGRDPRFLSIALPSGSKLYYLDPTIEWVEKSWGLTETIFFSEPDKNGTMRRTETHGAKLVENAVQSAARDVLVFDLLAAHDAGFRICGHCHDEILAEVPQDSALDVPTLEGIMAQPVPWAPAMLLQAEGHAEAFYRK